MPQLSRSAERAPSAIHRNSLGRSASDEILPLSGQAQAYPFEAVELPTSELDAQSLQPSDLSRPQSPPPVSSTVAVNRANALSKKLAGSNIPTQVTESGDLMLDMTGYKSSEEEALRAEVIARKLLAEELEGNYDIGALIGADERGNLWIYSSEEAKEAAGRKAGLQAMRPYDLGNDAASDPGYHSDSDQSTVSGLPSKHQRTRSDAGALTPPQTPPDPSAAAESNRSYAKTLRLTNDQLKSLDLKPGANAISFSVNRATCSANMYYWTHDVPIVVSDVDGTITKSDALGHVLNMIGRDWTHIGVAKLYTEIVANGYNIMYLTSRSVGQADTTRAYLNGITQEGHKLPKGPVILSPDRTIAALRREVYLRKPEVFKMACLRDIANLFPTGRNPFYSGFGNRLTDAMSYRSVNIPSTRIFTINSSAEVSLDLLTLNKYKSSYVNMREVVDHFFPPVSLLVKEGGEEFTDFKYWRDTPDAMDDFSASDSDDEEVKPSARRASEDEGSEGYDEDDDDDRLAEEMGESYFSRDSVDTAGLEESILESVEGEDFEALRSSLEDPDVDVEIIPESEEVTPLGRTKGDEGRRAKTATPSTGAVDLAVEDLRGDVERQRARSKT